jgi:hypothetical protein
MYRFLRTNKTKTITLIGSIILKKKFKKLNLAQKLNLIGVALLTYDD